MLCRLPGVVLQGGRFWAEEGVVYFSNAWTRPWYDAWFAIHTGYLNLAAGLGTWIGLRLGGLAYAPSVTVALALLIQCLPIYVILTHDFPWRRSWAATAAAVLACALPPVTGEVWLNTITSQFHLGLFAALVFAAPTARRGLLFIDCAVLVLAALSGPATVFLAPLFALAVLRDRTIRGVAPALIVLAGFCLQLGIYLCHIMPERGDRLGAAALLAIVSLHTIVLPFTGFTNARALALHLAAGQNAHRLMLATALIFIAFNIMLGAAVLQRRNLILARLLAASLLITLISFYEALNGSYASLLDISAGQRYAFIAAAAQALVIIGLASAAPGPKWGWRRLMFGAATILLLTVGVFNYRVGAATFGNGPPWRPQVAAWAHDPGRPLVVWPGAPWAFTARAGVLH